MKDTKEIEELSLNIPISPEVSSVLRTAMKVMAEQILKELRIKPKTRKRTISLHGAWSLYRISKGEILKGINSNSINATLKDNGRYAIDMDSLEEYFNLN